MSKNNPRPDWLTIRVNCDDKQTPVRDCLQDLQLGTVCSSARCPNQAECFSKGRATFLLMGPNCTRTCAFCAVDREAPVPLDPQEPVRVGEAVKRLKLKHVVITSVTRDDLPDGGAEHFVQTVQAVRNAAPGVSIEILVPDFQGEKAAWDATSDCLPDVYNHNVETAPRLYDTVRPQADFARSVAQLKYVKERHPQMKTKSGMMVGLGETFEEILQTAQALADAGVDMLTVGQYLSPISSRNLPVQYYMPPEEFERLENELKQMSFSMVAASPFVRSSYNAEEAFDATANRPVSG